MHLSLTLVLIIFTVIVSISAFSNRKIMEDLIFYPPAISKNNEWYRFFTSGLIHADIGHLAFNMIALYFFGDTVETIFKLLFGKMGGVLYLFLYISALLIALLPTYFRHKDNYSYRSLGASGAVSAVLFAVFMLYPAAEVYFFFIPIPIPGFIFGPLYLLISYWMDRRAADNVNHSAHIWGALYGLLFVIVATFMVHYPVFQRFVEQVQGYMAAKGWG